MRLMRDSGLLNEAEVTAIIDGALRILEKTGVRVENDVILNKLAEHGAIVDFNEQSARFSPSLISDFLDSSRKKEWSDTEITYSGSAEIYQGWYLDPEDGRYKPWSEERILKYVRLAKAIPSLSDIVMLGMPASDWPMHLQPLTEKIFCWKWGISGGSSIWDTNLCPKIYRLWDTWTQSLGLDIKKHFNGTVYMISPLKFGSVEAEQYVYFAERGLEVNVGSLGSLGGTSPVTPAGALALQTAEGFFLNFLRRAFFGHMDLYLGNSLSVIDMSTGSFQYGRPEQTLLNIAGAAVARRLGAAYGGHGGLSDAKEPGYEAAAQKMMSAIYNANAYGHGYIACGLIAIDEVFSPEQLMLDAEALSCLQHIAKGLVVDENTLALDAIHETGWGGQFLSHPHTAANLRSSLWFPRLFSKETYSIYSSRKGLSERECIRQEVKKASASAPRLEPQISQSLEDKLWNIVNDNRRADQ